MKKNNLVFCQVCGKTSNQVKKIITGPNICLCNECVHRAAHRLLSDDLNNEPDSVKTTQPLICDFCRKKEHEVARMIAFPNLHVCSECVFLCANILLEEDKSKPKLIRFD
jgi:ATP-dependent protease Clp ATPase subunit